MIEERRAEPRSLRQHSGFRRCGNTVDGCASVTRSRRRNGGSHDPRHWNRRHNDRCGELVIPSGHAMSAAVVYSTVAYLAARLHKRRWAWQHWRLSRSSGLAAIPGFCSTSSPLRSRLRPARLTFTNVAKLGHFLHEDLCQLVDPVVNEHVAGTRECSSAMSDIIDRSTHGGRSFCRKHP